ncbi:MAG TPA: hypothetical protein VGV35_09070, partial [Bryobacteraceae bacterium]|nr:hypothetical protein [Bryobacteraceae bacterium]
KRSRAPDDRTVSAREELVPGYQLIARVAASLRTEEQTLVDFQQKGWIQVVKRNGEVFLAADQRYRAKYILYLHAEKRLSDEQIQLVLAVQRPPYSASQVDEILKQSEAAPNSKHGGG